MEDTESKSNIRGKDFIFDRVRRIFFLFSSLDSVRHGKALQNVCVHESFARQHPNFASTLAVITHQHPCLHHHVRPVTHSAVATNCDNFTLIRCTNVFSANLVATQKEAKLPRLIGALILVDLISASLKVPDKRKCDENNNRASDATTEKPSQQAAAGDDDDEAEGTTTEKIKPKQMIGLFPLDLRSELKQRVGGKAGFSLKKSTTNVDIFSGKRELPSAPIPIKLPDARTSRPSDLLKSIQVLEIRKKAPDDSDDEGGQENLSFKEKLQLIERSSSKSLVNPL